MKIKISQAIYTDYVKRLSQDPLAFPKAWPGQVGVVDLDDDLADLVQKDAETMSGMTTSPTMATAYRSLANQIKKARASGIEPAPEVSLRNSGEFIELVRANIIVLNQVRTEIDEESIDELAEDIEAHGLINPITVRPAEEGMFFLIAGERRMRACTLAGVPIKARIIDADEERARRIQLAENIHREELSLNDRSKAVADLYAQLGNMQAVADLVKKSKAWVSKLVSLNKGLGYWADKVMNEGLSEDMEVLALMDAIDRKSYGTNRMWSIYEKIKAGKVGRKELQEIMKDIKKKEQQRDQPDQPVAKQREEEAVKAESATTAQQPRIPEAPPAEPQRFIKALPACTNLEDTLCQAWASYGEKDLLYFLLGGIELGNAVEGWTEKEEADLSFLLGLVEHWE